MRGRSSGKESISLPACKAMLRVERCQNRLKLKRMANLHFVPDEILASLQLSRNGKSVDTVRCGEKIRSGPFTIRCFP
jgi:hypothetical protein